MDIFHVYLDFYSNSYQKFETKLCINLENITGWSPGASYFVFVKVINCFFVNVSRLETLYLKLGQNYNFIWKVLIIFLTVYEKSLFGNANNPSGTLP